MSAFVTEELASDDPCDRESYGGDFAGSELEAQALMEEILRINSTQNLVATVHTHLWGNLWMHSWGSTIDHAGEVCNRTDDHEILVSIFNIFDTAFSKF